MPEFSTAQYVLLALAVACVPSVLMELRDFIRKRLDERQKRRLSHSITLIYQILDGSGYGRKDEGRETKGKQCVPRTWLVEQASRLEKEFESLGIPSINLLVVPVKAHLAGHLFRMTELLEDGNLKEARRFGNSFSSSLRNHPWDPDDLYAKESQPTFTDSTSIGDTLVTSSPI